MSLLLATAGGVLVVFLLVMFILSRIKVAGPNEAFIITGRSGRSVTDERGVRSTDLSGQKVVMGASVFVLPVVQRKQSLDLSSRRISVDIQGAVSKLGIRANLHGVAIVKVGGTEDAVRAAAQRFLHQQKEIEQFTREVLAGSLRAIVGRLTVEEIIGDRVAFANAVAEEAEHSMTNQGLVLDTFQVQDILTEGTYLQDLGRPEAARVLKDAAVAEAISSQAAEEARLLADEAIATAERNLNLKKAQIRAEVDAARARSAAAGPLAKAEQKQGIISEQQKVAERRAELKQRQLDIKVRRPADADRYRVEQAAEAARSADVLAADAGRQATIAAAQADAEQARLSGEGERARRSALAEAAEREGLAEGAAALARGRGDAEAMRLKADAFARYGDAAVLDLLARVLPQVVEAASRPLSAIDKLTVISTDGAAAVTRSVAANVAQGLQLGTDLTGVDLASLLAKLNGRTAAETQEH
ncbi:flotillin [Actinoplanes sp. NBRC 14428]|uniref:Flotillin n=1 Tax=Pseudosporangium ferrugineum TaxID=439699 RepID=A0A2T0S288_9ACTN|nr:flotillin family protein [Pseudosporangium ferrugineum]PRY27536.1 flotillin [Pseudosporangium ferrugineum]BCJ55698.1 flotillin [Actinoplanes sp. NBRC 14428]